MAIGRYGDIVRPPTLNGDSNSNHREAWIFFFEKRGKSYLGFLTIADHLSPFSILLVLFWGGKSKTPAPRHPQRLGSSPTITHRIPIEKNSSWHVGRRCCRCCLTYPAGSACFVSKWLTAKGPVLMESLDLETNLLRLQRNMWPSCVAFAFSRVRVVLNFLMLACASSKESVLREQLRSELLFRFGNGITKSRNPSYRFVGARTHVAKERQFWVSQDRRTMVTFQFPLRLTC